MNAQAEEVKASVKREVAKVSMTDGSTVEFVGKRKMLKTPLTPGVDGYEGAPAVRFDFKNGNVFLFELPDALVSRFATHGASQKIGDETAGEDDVDDMQLAVEDIAERLSKGEWSKEREGGGFGGTSILIQAMVEYSSKPIEVIRAFLKPKTKVEKDALRNSAKLKPIVDRLEAEKASKAAHVDTDKLFDDLDSATA